MRIYLAGPYAPYREVTTPNNISVARQVSVKLWEWGHYVFTPHLNTANFDMISDAPDSGFVAGYLSWLPWADLLILLPGWEHSTGSAMEIDIAEEQGIPIMVWEESVEVEPCYGDTLSRLWTSSVGLISRFYGPYTPEVDVAITAFEEEVDEFIESCMEDYDGQGEEGEVLGEAVDVIVTVLNALNSLGYTEGELRLALNGVIRKNNEKTSKTHAIDPNTGKITRRSKLSSG